MMRQLTKRLAALALLACLILSLTACGGKGSPAPGGTATGTPGEVTSLGEGETVFPFEVVDDKGTVTQFEIRTDADTVGKALEDVDLIQGEENVYGLYVKTVNGLTVDYDKDGKYWAFYANDERANVGVDQTAIEADTVYSFRVEE